jgi:hypothetical protein
MLDRDDDGGHTDGLAVLVLDRYLGLAVAADSHDGAVLAALVQDAADAVGELKRQRDGGGGLVGCIPVHRTLVPGSQLIASAVGIPDLQGCVDAACDVRTLVVQEHADREFLGIVAALGEGGSHRPAHVDPGAAGDLAGYDDPALGRHDLAGHARIGIAAQAGIEDRVGDVVAQLVGMPLADTL